MKNRVQLVFAAAILTVGLLTLGACTALTTLPDNKLRDTAGSVVGKPMEKVSNVRYVDDRAFYKAYASDGTVYNCQLSVLFGTTSQHQKCDIAKD